MDVNPQPTLTKARRNIQHSPRMSQVRSSDFPDMRQLVTIKDVKDMDTLQEENDNENDSDDSSYSGIERLRERTKAMAEPSSDPLLSVQSQPSSRRVSSDIDTKVTANLNTRRPSAIIAAFRRPSQALALCAATQKKFLSELSPNSRASIISNHEAHIASEMFEYDALTKALSALYAKLLVVLGLAFPVTEVIAAISDTYYQGFYLYLYGISASFIIFQYVNLFRQKAANKANEDIEGDINEKNDKPTPLNERPRRKKTISRYGSFYLRLGAIAFGIGSMVYSGLEFGQYFETDDRCRSILSILTPAIRMALTLLQMQFIFLTNKEIETGGHKKVQRFGFMHIIATNLCEWLYVLVEETKHEIHHLEEKTAFSEHNQTSHNDTVLCGRSNIMGTLLQNASPFLFPCTIEYSLICAVIFYEMWKELKFTPDDVERKINSLQHQNKHHKQRNSSVTPEKILQQFAGMLGVGSPYGSRAALHNFSIDCSHTHRGLFAGILIIVLTIISLIMFFVLAGQSMSVDNAIFQVNICELVLYSMTLVAAVIAMRQMRCLPYKRKTEAVLGLDTYLLVLAQSGMFVYCMFSMIGCHHTMYTENNGAGITGFFSELMSLTQTIVQSLFIIDAWWRRSASSDHRRTKPGRQVVTFLLVANMAMWAINTLEKNRAEFRPAHLAFYGPWAWTIITHVSMPLAIFYRFHSTICLFEIWKNSFMNKPVYLHV